jgi:hypothetical protein
MLPLLIIAAAYLWFNRPDLVSQIAGGINVRPDGYTTPFAQSLISTELAPLGSRFNPRLMTYTTFAVELPEGTTQAQADEIINNRLPSRNLPLRMHGFSNGTLWVTSITNDAAEVAGFENYLRNVPGAVVTQTDSQTVKYYTIAGQSVSELDLDAWIADCPRQKMLNPTAFGDNECPTSSWDW